MHPKILISPATLKGRQVTSLVKHGLLNSYKRQNPNRGKQWVQLTTTRSFSKEGPEAVFSTSFKGGQKVMAIRR